jgi:hypothetical protein
MIARKLLVHPRKDSAFEVLRKAAASFKKGFRARVATEASATAETYPQLLFAQPLSLSLRGWGDALAWLGRKEEAKEVF